MLQEVRFQVLLLASYALRREGGGREEGGRREGGVRKEGGRENSYVYP